MTHFGGSGSKRTLSDFNFGKAGRQRRSESERMGLTPLGACNLWANRIQRKLDTFRSVTDTRLVNSKGQRDVGTLFTGVQFDYEGWTFEIQVKHVKPLGRREPW